MWILAIKIWTSRFSGSRAFYMLMSTLILSVVVEAPRIIGGNATVVLGGTVVLPCRLTETTDSISQILWQRTTRGGAQNQHFLTILPDHGTTVLHDKRFKFIGDFNNLNASLQFSDVTLMDEGTYTCALTLFPSGNLKEEIALNLQVPPFMIVIATPVLWGTEEVSLATCTAAGSKPPAQVSWSLGTLPGKVRTREISTTHPNGTTTTVSWLFGVPSRGVNQHVVQCIITSKALEKEVSLDVTIQVHFSPQDVTVHEPHENTFQCVADASPDANISWTRLQRSLEKTHHSSVRKEAAVLSFSKMTSDQIGLYQCEATNLYGSNRAYLYVYVTPGSCPVCWTLLVLSLVALILTSGVLAYLYKLGVVEWHHLIAIVRCQKPNTARRRESKEEEHVTERLRVEEEEAEART